MATLKGVFPETAPVPKRNFIRENMLHIKKLQGITMNDAGDNAIINKKPQIKQQNVEAGINKAMKLNRNMKKPFQNFPILTNSERPRMIPNNPANTSTTANRPGSKRYHLNSEIKTAVESLRESERRTRQKEIGIQTESPTRFNESGVVRYATARPSNTREDRSPKNMGDGDKSKKRVTSPAKVIDQTTDKTDSGSEKKTRDYVKENAQVMTKSASKYITTTDPTMAPPTYQKGVLPKYLRDRKDVGQNTRENLDDKCPEGHVVLPENERKETLRMLRQSYSELVSELNQLPVRSDTLKIRNRKMEIENQLKKLDEGIKVFTRPKVYVKIGA